MNKPITFVRRWLGLAAFVVAAAGGVRAAEVIPNVPTRYFNDYALAVKTETANQLNGQLEDFEKQTSNQLLVVLYPKMQTDSSIEDYCHRTYASWHIGQKGTNNAAVLFIFVQDHKMHIEVGRGLEGALPDATCKDIISDGIAPHFKTGDFDGGVTVGVQAMMAAAKGEYKGTGQTDYEKEHAGGGQAGSMSLGTAIFLLIVFIFLASMFRRAGGAMITGAGSTFFGGGFGGGGGGFSSGGGGGGGFFSGGGGDSGAGGGASGDW